MEKEVVLLDAGKSPIGAPAQDGAQPQTLNTIITGQLMPAQIDPSRQVTPAFATPGAEQPEPRVLKLVKKVQVQVLCPQHNPVSAYAFVLDTSAQVRALGCCGSQAGRQA